MMVCIFPVLFVVILLPVFVRLYARQLLSANRRAVPSGLAGLRRGQVNEILNHRHLASRGSGA